MDPVEITVTGTIASFEPSRTMDPLPNCFSIWPRVSPRVRARSFSSIKRNPSKMSWGRKLHCTRVWALEFGRVVALARPDDHVLVPFHSNVDRMIETVGFQRIGAVEDVVLVAQLICDVFKVLVEVAGFEREEDAAAGFFGQVAQHFIAVAFDPGNVGGDGVDRHVGLLRHLERLVARMRALVVL